MRRTIAWALLCALLLAALCPAALAAQYVSASTPLGTDGARISNIRLAAEAINGVYVAYGSSFSFNDAVGARTTARGYQSAVNGRGVQVVGGGVAQVVSPRPCLPAESARRLESAFYSTCARPLSKISS